MRVQRHTATPHLLPPLGHDAANAHANGRDDDCNEAMEIRQAKWEAAEESAASVRDSLSQDMFEGEEEQDLWIWDNANTATGGDEADEDGADLGLEDRAVASAV
jgi:hypothetical protein